MTDEVKLCPYCETEHGGQQHTKKLIEAAQNRLNMHARFVDYPGGEIGFNRDVRLISRPSNPDAVKLADLERCESCNVPIGVGACHRCHEARHRQARKVVDRATTAEQQVKHMVERFLQWKLPADFHPDAGISFEPEFNVEWNAKQGKPPQRHEPVGTNLLSYQQAEAMVLYMLDDLPVLQARQPYPAPDVERVARRIVEAWESLPGPRSYSAREVQDWLCGPMTEAVNELRASLTALTGDTE